MKNKFRVGDTVKVENDRHFRHIPELSMQGRTGVVEEEITEEEPCVWVRFKDSDGGLRGRGFNPHDLNWGSPRKV